MAPEKDDSRLRFQHSTELSHLQRPTHARRVPCTGCHGEGKWAFKNTILIHILGLVNVDFEDVKTVMSEPGKTMMGTAVAGGPDCANKAANMAADLQADRKP